MSNACASQRDCESGPCRKAGRFLLRSTLRLKNPTQEQTRSSSSAWRNPVFIFQNLPPIAFFGTRRRRIRRFPVLSCEGTKLAGKGFCGKPGGLNRRGRLPARSKSVRLGSLMCKPSGQLKAGGWTVAKEGGSSTSNSIKQSGNVIKRKKPCTCSKKGTFRNAEKT